MSMALTPFAIVAIVVGIIAVPFLLGVILYNLLRLVFFLVARVVALIGGVVLDALRFFGHVIGAVLHVPLVALNALFLRFGDVRKHGTGFGRELGGVVRNAWSAVVLRPLRFIGILELTPTEPVREMPAMDAGQLAFDDAVEPAPKKKAKADAFDGYKVVGTLPRGGSGARLFIAEPKGDKAALIAKRRGEAVERVVIKSFSMEEGSTMPQIVRESRALEAARDLGLVLEHSLEKERFYYVMPYVAGEDLATVTRDLHHDSPNSGLNARSLRAALTYFSELLVTIERFHRQGLWHKDIKPSNVIVSKGRVHLVDLGLVTPLRSAMTLTTHGTEYFRDPDMVRLAMQGVKVHEVDGVKFDLYSAGALLYSMLENSFPAHGSLSRFSKDVPEALQWIVRRSMAEMHQRYGSASEMLADLQAVLDSPNPYLLKPAKLPSMAGKRVRLKDWQAGAPGAAFRQHGYTDRHGAGFGAGLNDSVREAGERLNEAGELVYEKMQHVTAKLHDKVSRKTARLQGKMQARATRKHRVRRGPVRLLSAAVILVLVVGAALSTLLVSGTHSSHGYPSVAYSSQPVAPDGTPGRTVSITTSYGNESFTQRFPQTERFAPVQNRDGSWTAGQYVSEQRVVHPDAAAHWDHAHDEQPQPEDSAARARSEAYTTLFHITPRSEFDVLRQLDEGARVLLLDDLAGAASSEVREALRLMPLELAGTGADDLSHIDALAEAKRAVGFAQPDDSAALGYLAEFLESHEDFDAVYWIGHVGGEDDVLGRLVRRP